MLNAKIIAIIPIFIAVNIAALLIWFLDISYQSMPLILGIIAGGLVDLDNRLRGRLKNIFYTLIAFSISSLIVQFFIGQPLLFILLMTLMTFVFTMLGAVGQRYSTIAFGTLVVALYTILTYLPATPWYINPLMILCGTLLYGIMAIIVHLFFPYGPLQESTAKSFYALADYLDAKSDFFDPDDIERLADKQVHLAMKNSLLIDAFNTTRIALFYRLRGQHRHSRTAKLLQYYFTAQDMHERANSSHFNYQFLTERLKNTDLIFRIRRVLELQAQACREIAQGMQKNQPYHYNVRLENAINGINQSFECYSSGKSQHAEDLPHIKTLLENLQNIDWQLRHLEQDQHHHEHTARARIHTENITGLANIFYAIRSHFTFQSQLFRHAIRLSIVVFVCCCIVETLNLKLDRGYWILLTAIFVCQPNYSATKLRLKQRIIGTIFGVLVGSLLPYMASTLEAKLGIVVLTSTLFHFFRTNNYSFSTFFITIQVLASFDIMGFDIYIATAPRLIDTLIGAVIAWLAVSYLWPDWKYLQLNKVSHQVIQSNAKYLLYIISQLQFAKGDDLKYRIVRRKTHENLTALNNTVSNMNSEPEKYASYLPQGFELLKINYSLLSYISALGAYRHNMKRLHQSPDFMAHFYPTAKKIIYLLENIDALSADTFTQLWQDIESVLNQDNRAYKENTDQPEFSVPIQQLNMISRVLPQLYALVKNRPDLF
ncbi:MAG TPA: TIGR01666 family membrane protein [Pasteurellaceae bacterium]|nr:TIGR01666 family membrane protein [Pasteurellaceae bacterium]